MCTFTTSNPNYCTRGVTRILKKGVLTEVV